MKIIKDGKEIELTYEEYKLAQANLEQQQSDIQDVTAELEALCKSEDEETAQLAKKWLSDPTRVFKIATIATRDSLNESSRTAAWWAINDEMYHFRIMEEARKKGQEVLVPRKIKLKICPFCGSHPLFDVNDSATKHCVRCFSCGIHTDEMDTPEEAAEVWNRRFYPSVEVEASTLVNAVPIVEEF